MSGIQRELDSNNHSVFLMYYHLVLVIKYRNNVLDDSVYNRAREIFEYIAPKYNIFLQEWNHDQNHVHVLFKGHPNLELSKFINVYKRFITFVEKRISRDSKKTLERTLLVKELLFVNDGWGSDRSHQKVY